MIIGGVIILSLVLTALGTMVFLSQQYDQYQQTANKMTQLSNEAQLENLVDNSPGLTANAAWTGCGGCNMYNMSLSNLGGVGVQIARIYITSSGCTSTGGLCVLNPSSSSYSYTFQQSAQFLNAGETRHAVLLYLPSGITLPYSYPPPNTITIVTSRGSVFSFQWPFPVAVGGQSQSAFSAGIMKIAYQCSNGPTCGNPGYDSKDEPGAIASGSGGTTSSAYCHTESSSSTPKSEQPQEFTGITYNGSPILDSGDLWFVNPWITQTILTNTCSTASGCSATNQTNLYFYVNITNTWTSSYTIAGGTLDLTWYGSNHVSGALIGFYDSKGFHTLSSGYTVAPNNYFYGVFRAYIVQLTSLPSSSVMFWGSLSITNNAKDTTFISGVALSSGLWVRYSC
jgi:hypothetical protein